MATEPLKTPPQQKPEHEEDQAPVKQSELPLPPDQPTPSDAIKPRREGVMCNPDF
jgi:hypothetical protein